MKHVSFQIDYIGIAVSLVSFTDIDRAYKSNISESYRHGLRILREKFSQVRHKPSDVFVLGEHIRFSFEKGKQFRLRNSRFTIVSLKFEKDEAYLIFRLIDSIIEGKYDPAIFCNCLYKHVTEQLAQALKSSYSR